MIRAIAALVATALIRASVRAARADRRGLSRRLLALGKRVQPWAIPPDPFRPRD